MLKLKEQKIETKTNRIHLKDLSLLYRIDLILATEYTYITINLKNQQPQNISRQ